MQGIQLALSGCQLIAPVTDIQLGMELSEVLAGAPSKIRHHTDPRNSLIELLINAIQNTDIKLVLIDGAQYLSDDAIEYLIELCSLSQCSTLLFAQPRMLRRIKSSPTAWSYLQHEITRMRKFALDEFLDNVLHNMVTPRWIYDRNSNEDRDVGKFLYQNATSFRDLRIILTRASAHAIVLEDEKITQEHIELALRAKRATIYSKETTTQKAYPVDNQTASIEKLNSIPTKSLVTCTIIARDMLWSDIRPQFHFVTGESGSGKSTIAEHVISLAKPRSYAGNTTGVLSIRLSTLKTRLQLGTTLIENTGIALKNTNRQFDPEHALFSILKKFFIRNDIKLLIIDNAHHLSSDALDYMIFLCESCLCNALLFGLPRLEDLLKTSFTANSYIQRELTKIEWFEENEFLNNILPHIDIPLWQYEKTETYDRQMGKELYKKIHSFRDLITILHRASAHAAEKRQKRIKKIHINRAFGNKRDSITPPSSPPDNITPKPGYSEIEERSDRRRAALATRQNQEY